MKVLGVIALILTIANQALAFGYECVSAEPDFRAKVIVMVNRVPETMTVELNGQVIYDSVAVVHDFSGNRNIFQSPGFINQNRAAASLYLQIFPRDGKTYGEFSENSFFPVVPGFIGECRQI